jgi:glutamine synthetase
MELGRDELVRVAPRTILHREMDRVAGAGLRPLVASELEFHLYRGTFEDARSQGYEILQPTTLARSDYTIQAGDQHEPFFALLREALEGSELDPWTSQVEWGLGQWEVNLRHREPLEMADRHILFKLAVRDLAAANGLAATFMAKPFADTTGSSCHLHLSVAGVEGTPLFHDPAGEHGTSAALRHAVGGVLDHASDLMLLYAPTVNSYRRMAGAEFSGNGRSWGWDSRMVSCRVLAESPTSTRLEWRAPGADVNPYLGIAALLASVRDGLASDADPGPPLAGEHWEEPMPPFPPTLGAAVDAFRGSAFAAEAFGHDVVAHYAEAGRWEWGRFLAADAVGEWERRRYFDVI